MAVEIAPGTRTRNQDAAVILYVFAFAYMLSEAVAYVERRIEFYASAR